jgi:putative ABC transport system substrate-binding protein
MNRRDMIALLGGAAAWPLPARAQQSGQMRRIGVLFGTAEGDPQTKAARSAFTNALQELGWTEGRNILIDHRWAAADLDRMQVFARELVSLRPDAIVAHTTQVVAALQRETKTIPIVFVVVSDPIGSGFVASLSRPGGNITGFINVEGSLSGKWIELLKDLAPGTSRAVLMFNPGTAPYFNYYLQPFEAAARSYAIEPTAVEVRSAADIERAVASLSDRPNTGLVLMPDAFMITQRNYDIVISLAARYRIPTIYPNRSMVDAGGLISYGIDNIDLFRRAPSYIDRIFKGASPADLPVQLPTKFEFFINLRAAETLGLKVSPDLLSIADEVIE